MSLPLGCSMLLTTRKEIREYLFKVLGKFSKWNHAIIINAYTLLYVQHHKLPTSNSNG